MVLATDVPIFPVVSDHRELDIHPESEIGTEKCAKKVLISKNIEEHEAVSHIKRRWNDEEEISIAREFKQHIIEKRNPSAAEIMALQEKYPILKERSIPVIKTKINNMILGKSKAEMNLLKRLKLEV